MEGTVFEGRVFTDDVTGCVEWTGPVLNSGYGYLEHEGSQALAHRLSYRLFRHDPGKLFVLHHCDNRVCINPDHLFLGTARDNLLDAIAKGRHPGRFPDWAVKKPRQRKLSDADVRLIRQSDMPARDLKKLLGVVQSTIYDIRNRKRKVGVSDDGPVTRLEDLL